VVAALPDTFGGYDLEGLWRALFATLDLFRWVATETAERLGYAYPTRADHKVTGWIETVFSSRA